MIDSGAIAPHFHAMHILRTQYVALLACAVLTVACPRASRQSASADATAGIDSLNARLIQAHRNRDPRAYAAVYTDSGVFEWPAFNTVRGHAGLEGMARTNFASLNDLDLKLIVASRRVAADHATEFGAFEESWRDSSGARMTEFGRYAAFLTRQADGGWLLDRFLGFEDSVRAAPAKR